MKKIKVYTNYYILLNDGQEIIDYKIPDNRGSTWKNVYDGDVVKVLGPVPSFKEIQLLKQNVQNTARENERLKNELSRRNANDKVLRRPKTKTL